MQAPNPRFAHLKALIVDDMNAMRANLRTQLYEIGINSVDLASAPNDVIKMVGEKHYDLIICDYNLNKETNGQQLLEYLRLKAMIGPTTLFVMITAEASYDYVANASEFQPDDYLLKPFTINKMEERIKRLLERLDALSSIFAKTKQRDFATAVKECDALIAANPKWSVEAMKAKASALMEMGRNEDAMAVYRDALEMRGDLLWAKMGLVRCDKAAGRLEDAKHAAQEIIEAYPNYLAAYDLIAKVAEEQGNDIEALEVLKRTQEIIPSARRSRLVAESAYRAEDLDLAREAFQNAITQTRGSLTAQPSDVLNLAQAHIDAGEPDKALETLKDAKHFASVQGFQGSQSAVMAQAHIALGDDDAAHMAFEKARQLLGTPKADAATVMLAKAALSMGMVEEGTALMEQAIRADHENSRIVAMVKKALRDTGHADLASDLVDGVVKQSIAIVEDAQKLMKQGKLDESITRLEQAINATPNNTAVLVAATQLYLLWIHQKGADKSYVSKIKNCLAKLDGLIPGDERLTKMHRFFRETLAKASGTASNG